MAKGDAVRIMAMIAGVLLLAACSGERSSDGKDAVAQDSAEVTTAQLAKLTAVVNNAEMDPASRRTAVDSILLIAPGSDAANAARAMLPAINEAERIANIGKQWAYRFDADKMSGEVMAIASVASSNTISLDFPYAGAQRGRLGLRNHPRWGRDVIFAIERGQIPCTSWDGCSVKVRFDNEKPFIVGASRAEDGSTEAVFLKGYASLERKIRTSKKMLIEVNIYHGGSPVFEFDIDGFDPQRMKPQG